MNAQIRVGTSGWSYPHWRGSFYPEDLSRDRHLEYYAGHFATVEINKSFYSLPETRTLRDWARRTPEDFVFAAKMSRYLSHMKKLRDPAEPLARFFEHMDVLGDALGPVLVQLPPHWHFDEARLKTFLEALDRRHRFAFEFRDPSWFDDRALALLEEHGAALCLYDLGGETSPRTATADFVYVRLHGPQPGYRGSYDTQTLAGWAGAFSTWRRQGRDVYCYFDNDADGNAPRDASRLADMVA